MSNTLMPFLYHTRTLTRLAKAGSPTLRSGLHTTSRRGIDHNRKSAIPFELPDDLDIDTDYSPDVRDTLTPTEREIFKDIFREIYHKNKKPNIPKSASSKPLPPTVQDAPQEGPGAVLAGLLAGPAAPEKKKKMDPLTSALTVNAIMEDAAHQYHDTKPLVPGLDPLSPLEATYSASEREKALLRFPPTLRKAARQAFGLFDLQPFEDSKREAAGRAPNHPDPVEAVHAGRSQEQIAMTVEIEAKRMRARVRIREQMEACTNDHDVWQVMENCVFTLVERLGISDVSAPDQLPKLKSKKGRSKKDVSVDAEAATEAEAAKAAAKRLEGAELDMEIYGPMYPQLLIDALNILGTRFTRPSPYMLHMLPRIKELGLVSYVLGISTAFYNRLILILWTRYGDATGVLNLLEEMEHAGLSFDEDSLSVVSKIEAAYGQANQGERGRFVQELMRTPEYEPIIAQRIRHWVGHILANMKDRDT